MRWTAALRTAQKIAVGRILYAPQTVEKGAFPLGPLWEGAPPAGGGGENCAAARNISGYGKVLSLRPYILFLPQAKTPPSFLFLIYYFLFKNAL